MGYGLLGLKDHMENQAIGAFRDLSQEQQQNKIAEDQMKQAQKQQQMSMIGTGASIGFAVGGPVGGLIGAGVGLIGSMF